MDESHCLSGGPSEVAYADPNRLPLYDSWWVRKDIASWIMDVSLDDDPGRGAVNRWFAASIEATLEAFEELLRPAEMAGGDCEPGGPPLRWEPQGRCAAAEDRRAIEAALLAYPTPLDTVEIKVDLCVEVRVAEQASAHTYQSPRRTWIRSPDKLVFMGGPKHFPSGLIEYSVNHTLFTCESLQGDDNAELHALNQPILARALRRWEAAMQGRISEVEGQRYGAFRYGFGQQ